MLCDWSFDIIMMYFLNMLGIERIIIMADHSNSNYKLMIMRIQKIKKIVIKRPATNFPLWFKKKIRFLWYEYLKIPFYGFKEKTV